jgi:hypothetical protein
MRLQSYILNEGRTNPITQDRAIEILRTNSPKTVKWILQNPDSGAIFRGINNSGRGNFHFVQPKNFSRKSANTTNHYTVLMDNSVYWRAYPKRSESIICSSDPLQASSYGYLFFVIPEDVSKILLCPKLDIWISFEKNINCISKYQ